MKRVNALIIFVLSISLASAGLQVGNYSVYKVYNGGDIVIGKFEINFTDYNNIEVNSSLGGGMKLLELLEKSGYLSGDDYICNPANCEKGYTSSNGQITKVINLDSKKVYGFVLSGKEVVIRDDGFSLGISSNVGKSSINQLSIDLFNDNTREFFNDNYVNEVSSSKNYGCFSDIDANEEIKIPTPNDPNSEPYCEKINLTAAPAYRIGAKIRNSTQSGNLKMELYNGNGDLLADCTLPKHKQSVEELYCTANYSAKTSFEAFVCISASSGNYKIRTENKNSCGVQGANPSQDYQQDYEIYAQGMKYGTINKKLNEDLYQKLNNGESLIENLQDYIDENYNSDCDPECVIPFSIFGANQQVTLNNLEIEYDALGKNGAISNRIYDISEKDFSISSKEFLEFLIEDLEIEVPPVSGARLFKLNLGDDTIIDNVQINISTGFIFDITPKSALIGHPTKFKITGANVSSSTWDFDGEVKSSNSDEIVYSFPQQGDYELSVTAKNNKNETSTKKFIISVGNPKESANLTIREYEKRISNLTNQIKTFPEWIKKEIEKTIDIAELNSSLKEIKEEFENAVTEDDYIDVVDKLFEMGVPSEIKVSNSGTLPIEVGLDNIDVSYIEELSNEKADDSEKLKESIMAWMYENYDVDVSFETISAFTDTKEELLTKFSLNIKEKNDVETAYLFIGYPIEQINFKSSYGEKEAGSGTYILLENIKTIEFSIEGDVRIEELGAYISPTIDKLSIKENISPIERLKKFKTKGFIILISILIIVFFVVYIILQEWYKRHYEAHLFPKKDDLYNVINFIYNGRHAGLRDSEIRNKLSQKGWKGEQISYAFKKIDGKRTGMLEIPIFKFFENKKVKEEIGRRQKGQIDARFIKQPGL